MRILDLGEIEGDVVLFGGIYSNKHALDSFVHWLSRSQVPTQNCICTGDIVAYCAHPAEVTDAMIANGIRSIAGNCERQLASGATECGCGFEDGTSCDLASKNWYPYAVSHTQDHIQYYADLPDIITFAAFEKRYAVIHGGVTDIARFIWPTSDADMFREEFAAVIAHTGQIDGIICGHSGVPFERVIDGKAWINAGVIGMPPHDGRPQTRFAVLSDTGVRFHRLDYDAEGAGAAMVQAGLTQGYEVSLQTGVWPSEDVLPTSMRR